jgi:hypothetical protein
MQTICKLFVSFRRFPAFVRFFAPKSPLFSALTGVYTAFLWSKLPMKPGAALLKLRKNDKNGEKP